MLRKDQERTKKEIHTPQNPAPPPPPHKKRRKEIHMILNRPVLQYIYELHLHQGNRFSSAESKGHPH